MCGIVGVYNKLKSEEDLTPLLAEINHRGPDDSGVWNDDLVNLHLGHARLAIVDLSSAGHQPMYSRLKRYVMVFNGEIYNHKTLRAEINKEILIDWQGHSDTETLLAAIELWGIEETLQKVTGMFAIALWDIEKKLLHLVRDRLGEKPLYFGWQKDSFLFSSELKALKKHPSFQGNINRKAIALYFKYNYVPTPYSIYEGIHKLKPGYIVTLDIRTCKLVEKQYWSLKHTATNFNRSQLSSTDYISELNSLLTHSIEQQMMADVPLGAFLSGGIDSTTVVSIMQYLSNRPIKTFTMGFDDKDFNEAEHAKAVANHLKTEHYEFYVKGKDALGVIPRLPEIYDEPFADSSQIPTYLVSKLAKEHVTVSLSGDAGDELFSGYNRYTITHDLWGKLNKLPRGMRNIIGSGLTKVSPDSWDNIANLIKLDRKFPNLGHKVHKGARVLGAGSFSDLYLNIVSNWEEPLLLVKGVDVLPDLNISESNIDSLTDIEKMMLWDGESYLVDDILVKLDRATMAVSLESRVPFLNHNVVEFAWKIPQKYKINEGQSKWILRQVLYKYVPKELIERPKKGFSLPLAKWLRNELKDWAYSLIEPRKLLAQGFLHEPVITNKWLEHQTGKRDWSIQLWSVLMFQAWLEDNL
ncbi:asparagine synthase (glutamine-hydrolyzing) [Endozoicomonas sp. G2_1]|uniref:asparagine synthase (glutamine-hydrolyzing) n=1 Tax=Endozoicomonas sp. G2_1 TaxID=2821091 RepID=UPI001ADC8915|nr:asparagine synthase (glutamine-hydrolyzing) [Endozoicomonas sp. G2_1]MBO9488988.1 asparagine synthase (glutamine-hydrolyzing) [Endozoicomonas sp. G2_1]